MKAFVSCFRFVLIGAVILFCCILSCTKREGGFLDKKGVSPDCQDAFFSFDEAGLLGGSLYDADSNIYGTKRIGTQEWMVNNLRTTSFSDGSLIASGLDNEAWSKAMENETSAYAIYAHEGIEGLYSDTAMVAAYGKLYNWYSVYDARGLCPEGWRVPTIADWNVLLQFLKGEGSKTDNMFYAGNALRAARQGEHHMDGIHQREQHPRWDERLIHHKTYTWGFSALLAGCRSHRGTFLSLGFIGYMWSSTGLLDDDGEKAFLVEVDATGKISVRSFKKSVGLSIRCMREL